MNQRVYKSCSDPLRGELSWDERWKGPDGGLITEKNSQFREHVFSFLG